MGRDSTFRYQGPQTAAEHRARCSDDGDLWVFAYGSLMWRPGFDIVEEQPAILYGWHRALCVLSVRYRGTPANPGLVLGLDRGGSCRGIAFRISALQRAGVVEYLDQREMVTRAYCPRFFQLFLSDGRRVDAYGYVADRNHPQYGGGLSEVERVRMIQNGQGSAGPCIDYLRFTVDHLDKMGIHDQSLERVLALVGSA